MSTSADKFPQVSVSEPQGCRATKPLGRVAFDLAGMAAFLRRSHPYSTAYHVSAATGISAATVENWLLGRSGPDRDHLSMLMCVYGPAFLKAVLSSPPDWVSRAYRQAVEDELRTTIAEASAALSEITDNGPGG